MDRAPVRIAALSLAVTSCLLALKLTLGIISGSIAVISDAVDSGTDLTAGFAALLSVRIAAQPADEEHPYGHGKVESISAAVAATIVALGGGFVVVQAVRRLAGDQPDIDVGVGLIAMVIAAGANAIMFVVMRREARRANSLALQAESKHLETNVVQAGVIIAGLVLVGATGEDVIDPIFALVLAAYMGYTALGLIRTAASDIMDTALPPEDMDTIRDVLATHSSEVTGYHRLRTRRSGAERHVDVHITVEPGMTVDQAHHIADGIEHEIQSRLHGTVVVIHLEPDDRSHPPKDPIA